MKYPYSFGALESPKDNRTVKHEDLTLVGTPLIKGGIDYLFNDIENQFSVGICTAISLTQNRTKATGRKYSADFQYLLQKKFYDKNWIEGSSIFSALKVGIKYGFLPVEHWTYTTILDRNTGYANYISKLQAIPDSEIQRLLTLCVDRIAGYAQVNVKDSQALAKAIDQSDTGILCRYSVGQEWWVPPINPLRPPQTVISGHAITMSKFDYTINLDQVLANTWGMWNKQGLADVDWNAYKPTEAWIILNYAVIRKQIPNALPSFIQIIVDLITNFFKKWT